ncbi:MAG: hypothetical protein M1309_06220 [Actinobacteria bacterium]|nr:hypothetical protein [Actinomycetota bacterium]
MIIKENVKIVPAVFLAGLLLTPSVSAGVNHRDHLRLLSSTQFPLESPRRIVEDFPFSLWNSVIQLSDGGPEILAKGA